MFSAHRRNLLDQVASSILSLNLPYPTRVAIDGVDAAGKTTLAEELATILADSGRQIIRASIDGFHNPAALRHLGGDSSPEGYYNRSFNYASIIESLLVPLGPRGSRRYRKAVFDYRSDAPVADLIRSAAIDAILLFDGVFLLRSEIAHYWDFTIFVAASFETTLERAKNRDAALMGGTVEVTRRYQTRYIPGQQLYFAQCRPQARAHVVIDNDDPAHPSLTVNSHS